jgi:hypothetical protein
MYHTISNECTFFLTRIAKQLNKLLHELSALHSTTTYKIKHLQNSSKTGSEAWTIRKADEKRLQAAEMKFMRKSAGFTLWDHKRNEENLKILKV